MTRPRQIQVCADDTPYYHIVSRCVRRSFLCGVDRATGTSYEHRRSWIENRLRLLASIFSIEVCAYAVMSNHLHLVVKLCPEQTQTWSDADVAARWTSLFKGPVLLQRWQNQQPLSPAEIQTLKECLGVYRDRLSNLGWFMKCLNEPIAKRANQEDNCTGHFWEARYKSQALLTEEALLSCMSYVDLNPLRAGMADTPERSEYTSIKERIAPAFNPTEAVREQMALGALQKFDLLVKPLAQFEGNIAESSQTGILFSLRDYLELVDFTGRCLRNDKRDAIPSHYPSILQRLHLDKDIWITNTTQFEARYRTRFSRRPAQQRFYT